MFFSEHSVVDRQNRCPTTGPIQTRREASPARRPRTVGRHGQTAGRTATFGPRRRPHRAPRARHSALELPAATSVRRRRDARPPASTSSIASSCWSIIRSSRCSETRRTRSRRFLAARGRCAAFVTESSRVSLFSSRNTTRPGNRKRFVGILLCGVDKLSRKIAMYRLQRETCDLLFAWICPVRRTPVVFDKVR